MTKTKKVQRGKKRNRGERERGKRRENEDKDDEHRRGEKRGNRGGEEWGEEMRKWGQIWDVGRGKEGKNWSMYVNIPGKKITKKRQKNRGKAWK